MYNNMIYLMQLMVHLVSQCFNSRGFCIKPKHFEVMQNIKVMFFLTIISNDSWCAKCSDMSTTKSRACNQLGPWIFDRGDGTWFRDLGMVAIIDLLTMIDPNNYGRIGQ